jgi:multicomponent Na+:H+ antiporter subunit B
MAASAFILQAMAEGNAAARRSLPADPTTLMAAGLGVALAAGAIAMAQGRPFLTGLWTELHAQKGGGLHLGTPLLFDFGVYCVVAGTALAILLGFEDVE